MPANHNVPHTAESRAKIGAAKRGKPLLSRRRPMLTIDGIDLYRCGRCLGFKPKEAFYTSKRTLLGITSDCKKCHCELSVASRDQQVARDCSRVSAANARAREYGCDGILSVDDYRRVLAIFDGKCAKCQSPERIEIDHVIALSRNGDNLPRNLQCLCSRCNDHKHVRTWDYRTETQRIALAAISFSRLEHPQ